MGSLLLYATSVVFQIESKISVIKTSNVSITTFREYESKLTCRSFTQETFIMLLENASFMYFIFPT